MKPRRGFTLLEMVIVMAALSTATALTATILLGALRVHKISETGLQALSTRQALADQFRADVAQSHDAPPRWQQETAGPTCLILLRGPDRTVLYRWEADRLSRTEIVGEKTIGKCLGGMG